MTTMWPAEFEAHRAVWLAWPGNASDWPGKFSPIAWVYGEMIRKLTGAGERVRLLVRDAKQRVAAGRVLSAVGADLALVEWFKRPMDRGWTRDFMPFFVRRGGKIAAVDFGFTGWAKYPDHTLDDQVGPSVCRELGMAVIPAVHGGRRVVLEGGGMDGNGRGDVLTTEECLLDPAVQVRNPGFGRADYEAVFREYLGAKNVIWLGKGIAGDDTHGHVDDLCRFVSPGTVVLCREDDPADDNYAALSENRERLQGLRLADGGALAVVDLPMPRPVVFRGQRLPASYANFLIADRVVLVPTFNDSRDRLALGILAELFPGREVVGIAAVDLVWGLGTIHCLSHEEPAV
ncbi:MAG: peptidylarginine deiminase-like enzyme [Solidesulfovibrio magneticus str. Maddingley MBC34]|uniref:Peptidylarginine deiminase-like enzyme n=1 Tax=Solidesulfovibrio magneticus str. Maddingley MBC34 TaxID=1206767 RepID=K6G9D7_9BACT|nr:MAG: peptidylarginine deiminase-like enzyme [Solidesulfovibrio magneticus str. Maddingley MBC34]